MTKKITSYEFWPDIIRVVAILGVVAIHTVNSVYQRPDFFGGASWWLAISINSLSRICIPLFIMISGYFMLKKDYEFKVLLKKILTRLLIPLVFWTVLIYVLGNPNTANQVLTPDFYLRFFSGNVYYFYFLIILIGLYFVTPLIRSYIKNSSIQSQRNLAIGFLIVGIVETAEEYFVRSCASENSFTKWVPYTGLFILGFLIGTGRLKFKNNKITYLVYLIGFIATLALNYVYFHLNSINLSSTLYPGCLSQYSDYYLSFNVVLMSVPAFFVLSKINYSFILNGQAPLIKIFKKLIYQIARASFGIYLTHLFFVNIWDYELNWTVDAVHIPLWAYILIKWAAVFVVSFLFSLLLKKIPLVRKLIGED
jgi:surface polysaccharide O-acyltransferase-like enzyme